MKNNTWKTPVIILVGIITVIGLIWSDEDMAKGEK